MSEENVEIVRRAYKAWSADDFAAAFAAIDEHVVAARFGGDD